MANLTLVYGMRLLPSDEIKSVGDAPGELKNGHTARVTMHVLEGSKEEIEAKWGNSVEAFFNISPEIKTAVVTLSNLTVPKSVAPCGETSSPTTLSFRSACR